jgi:hypothetical protein
VDAREWQRGQNGGHHEVESAFKAGLEKTGPHGLLPEVDHHNGQDD